MTLATLFLRQLILVFADSARLAEWRAPEAFLFPFPGAEVRTRVRILPCLAFKWVLGI